MSQDDAFKEILRLAAQKKFIEAAEAIRSGLKENFASLAGQGRSINLAHLLVLAADWGNISSLVPKGTNFFLTSGWLNSLYSGSPVNATGEPVPWLTYPAIDFLEGRLQSDWKVFEWGSGNSTIWWSNRVHQVSSVEDNEQWYNKCKDSYKENVAIKLMQDREQYVKAISLEEDVLFDVVVIDGSYRNDCAREAVNRVSPDGIIIFDNSDVLEHEDGVRFISESGWKRIDFFGLIPSYLYKNCTSIFFRTDKIVTSTVLPARVKSSTGLTCSQAMKL